MFLIAVNHISDQFEPPLNLFFKSIVPTYWIPRRWNVFEKLLMSDGIND